MRRQRNMDQMKEQIKTPEKELNKVEKSHLSDAKFKTLVIRMLKELTGDFNCIKKNEAEIKVTLSEIKKNYRETTVEYIKLRVKPMIRNVRKKKKTFNQNSKKKKESKKLRIG